MTEADAPAPVALFKKRGLKNKTNLRKRPASPPPEADSDSDFSSSEDESGQRIKRRRKTTTAVVNASSKGTARGGAEAINPNTIFQTDRERDLALDSARRDATKGTEWFDEGKGENLSEKNLLGKRRTMPQDKDGQEEKEGTYKGLKNQTKFIEKNPDRMGRQVGPVKASGNVRMVTIVDMAPDVCKDYKNTGFCGFGDNCKFLHAREDYQAGWQLDKEWENVTKGKKVIAGTVVASADRKQNKDGDEDADEAEEAMLEGIPFACIICQGPYKSPVVTRCGHYFCEACALKKYRKDPGCAACGSGTGGVFNAAKRLQKLLEKKRERAARKKQEAIEAGEDVSDEGGPGGSDDD